MSDALDHLEWASGVVQRFIADGSKPNSPEWDSRESYIGYSLVSLGAEFDQFSRKEKQDIFLFMLGVVVSTADMIKGEDE